MFETEFYNFLVNAGYAPEAPIPADGDIKRCPAPGDKPGRTSGWYALHADPPAAVYGDWRTREEHTWRPANAPGTFDYESWRRTVRQQREERAERQAEERKRCREVCGEIWRDAAWASDDHDYLARKRVQAHGIKVSRGGVLIVPVRDAEGTLHGVQYIPVQGEKRFKKGTAVMGHYFLIGEPRGRLLIAEGYATAATVHEVTGDAVAVAFTSCNLQPVAEALRAAYPDAELVVCGDDDRGIPGNPGRTTATEAAQAVGGLLAIPEFTDEAAGTDFNDLYLAEGESAVRAQLQAAVNPSELPQEPGPPEVPEPAEIPELPEPAEPSEPPEVASPGPAKPSLFVSAADLVSTPCTVDYLVRKWVERDTTGQLFGPTGSGKTFVIMSWCLAVGTGRPVHGNRTKRGLVLYLAGEGHGGIKRRVRAWQLHHNVPSEELRTVHVSKNTIALDGSGVDAVAAQARGLAEAHGMPVAMFVVDTLARHMQGDENSAQDMSAFVQSVDTLRSSFPGAVVVIVHHTGHGDGMRGRGSSALRGAMDFDVHCDKGLLTFYKMKDADLPPPVPFTLRPVVVGEDDEGEPLTSCIVEYGERTERHGETTLTAMERVALETLVKAAAATEMADGDRLGALVGDWRKTFYEARRAQDVTVSPNTLKQAFGRAAESLSAKKLVSQREQLRIPEDPRHQNEIRELRRVQGTQLVLVP